MFARLLLTAGQTFGNPDIAANNVGVLFYLVYGGNLIILLGLWIIKILYRFLFPLKIYYFPALAFRVKRFALGVLHFALSVPRFAFCAICILPIQLLSGHLSVHSGRQWPGISGSAFRKMVHWPNRRLRYNFSTRRYQKQYLSQRPC